MTISQYRVKIGEMLKALHPIYGAAKGTATESMIVERVDNARRQLELVFAQLPTGSAVMTNVPSSDIVQAFNVAESAYRLAIAAPGEIGFIPKQSFGDTLNSSLQSAKQGLSQAVDAATKTASSFNALTVAGIALGIIIVAAILTRGK